MPDFSVPDPLPGASLRYLRKIGLVLFCVLLAPTAVVMAQQLSFSSSAGELAVSEFAHADESAADPVAVAPVSISGTVKDSSDVSIAGAVVTLVTADPNDAQHVTSDEDGAFRFAGVVAGPYRLTVEIPGFHAWTTSGYAQRGQAVQISDIALAVASVDTDVEVVASSHDVAEAQLGFEEKQRVLGVFPNFYASYVWNADPLSARQKFSLAWRFSVDPVAFGMAAVVAAGEQGSSSLRGYGPGAPGYAKRFGATYADGFVSTMIGQAILPAAFHQDPRYFVKGTGSVQARALYAIATAVICKGDNRRWQLNYSNILGNVASAGLANVYYPAANRQGLEMTVENSLVSTGLGAVGGLIQEFFLHRMTPNVPDYAGAGGQ